MVSAPEWHPELGLENLVNAVETDRRDARHRKHVARESDCLAHHRGIVVEAAMPEASAQYDYRLVLFAVRETAPAHHAKFSDIEEICADCLTVHAFRFSATTDGGRHQQKVARNCGKRFHLFAKIVEEWP